MRINRSHRALLWCSLLTLSAIGSARGQSTAEPTEPRLKRFSIALYAGAAVGGPAAGLESEMRAAGLDKTTQCWLFCEGPIHHPKSYAPGMGSMIALKYRFRPRLAVQLLYGSSSTGQTIGASGGFGGILILDHGVRTLAGLATFEEGPLQLGLGPALYGVRAVDLPVGGGEATKLGLMADAGLQFPHNSRFFVDLRAQYRWVGSVSIGPYQVSAFDEETVLPECSPSFNHLWFSVGFGFRL